MLGSWQQKNLLDGARGRQADGRELRQSPLQPAIKELLLIGYAWGHWWPPHNLWELCYLHKLFGGIPLFLMLEWVPWRDSPIAIATFIR